MPELKPFRGIRYASDAGPLADLVSPPYDVIGPEDHVALCRRSPYNAVRLILGERRRAEAPPADDWYERAKELYRAWLRQGILVPDPEPAFYLYVQRFNHQGERRQRTLVMGALRLEPYEEGSVLPHENTMPGPKADRLRLMRACPANLSPILAFFPDPEARVRDLLAGPQAEPLAVFADERGIDHELRPLWSADRRAALADALAPLPLYIADGHHRYETALAYRRLQRAGHPAPEGQLPCDYVLAACMSSADPGLVIRPTHRVLRWAGEPTADEVVDRAAAWFDVQRLAEASVDDALAALADRAGRAAFALHGGQGPGYTLLELRDEAALAESPYPSGSPVRRLPAAVFTHGFVSAAFTEREPEVSYEACAARATAQVDAGAARMAALLPGVRAEELMAVVNAGQRMPPKSTYFWPKPRTGMVFRSLEEL
ncbi:MAG: DUF1015 domain-containing protein [Candidatus Brocadiia bacterium]